ncbi:MAG: helix-turn-helix transcriptional regulator [Clostridia bacterium]|nr:helix-turn-helix transcriptional regulator [Clostridia bacterium]
MENKQLLKDMGERACLRRKTLGYTQEQLAEKINVSVQMISNLELGKKAIRPENIVKLCSALEISTDYLLTGIISNDKISKLSDKLTQLSPEALKTIEQLLDLLTIN